MRTFSLLTSISLALTLTACSVETPSNVSADAPLDEATASHLVGTYAMKITLATKTKSAFLPDISGSNELYRLGQIVKSTEGEGLQILELNCAVRAPNTAGLKISVKDTTVQSIGQTKTDLAVSLENGALKLSRGKLTQVLGAKLANIETDKLPTDTKDSRLIDADKDGKPGATTTASFGLLSGDLYFVQRSTNTYFASEIEDGTFKGNIQDSTEQSLIGKSSILIPSAVLSPVTVIQDPAVESTIEFVKIDSAASCASVLNHFGISKN